MSTNSSQVTDSELREKWHKIVKHHHEAHLLALKEHHAGIWFTTNRADLLEEEIMQLIAQAQEEAERAAVSAIYGIANDLANKDPDAIGSVSLAPYFANAVAIYQEYLNGDDFERIDWKALGLPTLNRLAQLHPKESGNVRKEKS